MHHFCFVFHGAHNLVHHYVRQCTARDAIVHVNIGSRVQGDSAITFELSVHLPVLF